jgi:hypothetical protein
MDAITKAYDGKVQMIDTSTVRVHQRAAGVPLLMPWAGLFNSDSATVGRETHVAFPLSAIHTENSTAVRQTAMGFQPFERSDLEAG